MQNGSCIMFQMHTARQMYQVQSLSLLLSDDDGLTGPFSRVSTHYFTGVEFWQLIILCYEKLCYALSLDIYHYHGFFRGLHLETSFYVFIFLPVHFLLWPIHLSILKQQIMFM